MAGAGAHVRWGRLLFAAAAYSAVRWAPAPAGLSVSGQQVLTMAVDAVIFYPVQTATSLIVYEAGGFTPREVFLLGWVMLALTASVVVFVAIPYWRWWGLSLVVRAQ